MESSVRGPKMGVRQKEKKLNVRIRQDSGCFTDSLGSPDIYAGQMDEVVKRWIHQTFSVIDQEKSRMSKVTDHGVSKV